MKIKISVHFTYKKLLPFDQQKGKISLLVIWRNIDLLTVKGF